MIIEKLTKTSIDAFLRKDKGHFWKTQLHNNQATVCIVASMNYFGMVCVEHLTPDQLNTLTQKADVTSHIKRWTNGECRKDTLIDVLFNLGEKYYNEWGLGTSEDALKLSITRPAISTPFQANIFKEHIIQKPIITPADSDLHTEKETLRMICGKVLSELRSIDVGIGEYTTGEYTLSPTQNGCNAGFVVKLGTYISQIKLWKNFNEFEVRCGDDIIIDKLEVQGDIEDLSFCLAEAVRHTMSLQESKRRRV